MARKDQRRAFLGFLVRMPGALIVAIWLALFLASFGVVALVDWAEYQTTVLGQAHRRVDRLERSQYRPDNPFAQQDDPRLRGLAEELLGSEVPRDSYAAAVDSAFEEEDPYIAAANRVFGLETLSERLARLRGEQVQAESRIVTAFTALRAAALGWLLAFAFVTVGTRRWIAAREGWSTVQSWHGGKLLMLYVPFTAATLLYAAAATAPIDDDGSTIILFVTSALLLLACAAMLVRATWNWLTGRERKRRVESTPGNQVSLRSRFVTPLLQLMRHPRAAAAIWLILGLLIGAIAATFALQPRTYADCILRGMKYTPTATATRALQQACGQKFGSVTQQTSGVAAPRPPRAPQVPRR